jgi:hypothetical protein
MEQAPAETTNLFREVLAPMTENLDVFFYGLDTGEAVFELASGPRSVRCYFDNSFFDASVGETVLDTTQPRITAKLADVRDIPRETICTVAASRFSVIQIQPEGTGLATVILAHE